jgi:hypothetical protein
MATVATFGIGLLPSESAVATFRTEVATFGTEVATFVYDVNHHGILNSTNTQRRQYMHLRIGHVTADFITSTKNSLSCPARNGLNFP